MAWTLVANEDLSDLHDGEVEFHIEERSAVPPSGEVVASGKSVHGSWPGSHEAQGAPWRLYENGVLVVDSGTLYICGSDSASSPWSSHRELINRIIFTGEITFPPASFLQPIGLFGGLTELIAIYGLEYFDTKNATDMRNMFFGASSLESLDLSSWDMSNVTDIGQMFAYASNLTSLDVSNWDTGNVLHMGGVFRDTRSLASLDISHWDTSNITIMNNMFNGASSLTSLDLSGWDVSNVSGMWQMFDGAHSLAELNLTGWNVSNVRSMENMFRDANSLVKLDFTHWDTSNVGWASEMLNMLSGTNSLRQLVLGSNFTFVVDRDWWAWANIPNILQNTDFTGYWQNVGTGTVENPQGAHVFTSFDLVHYYDGATMADTWVWQPRTSGPATPPPLTPVALSIEPMVATGTNHVVALKNDGTVFTWGNYYAGETVSRRNVPYEKQGLNNIAAVATGSGQPGPLSDANNGYFSLALRRDGTVWAWGDNSSAQLGDGTRTNRVAPVQVHNLDSVIAISAGSRHSLALRSDGTVWAWGGTGEHIDHGLPVQVVGLSNVISIAAGDFHSLALRADGTVWAWGFNSQGALGDGSNISFSSSPVQVAYLNNVTAIVAGHNFSIALREDGAVWSWGANHWRGSLGDGTWYDRNTPVQVLRISDAIAISAGGQFSMALCEYRMILTWGRIPEPPRIPDGGRPNPITGLGPTWFHSDEPIHVLLSPTEIFSIAAGGTLGVAIRNDGTVWAWGTNRHGQIGDGTNYYREDPVQVVGPDGVGHLNLFDGTPPPPTIIPGDANGDGMVTAADVGTLRAYLSGHPAEIIREAADVNGDGQITAADLGLIRAYLAGHPVPLLPAPRADIRGAFMLQDSVRASASSASASPGEYVDITISLDENYTTASLYSQHSHNLCHHQFAHVG